MADHVIKLSGAVRPGNGALLSSTKTLISEVCPDAAANGEVVRIAYDDQNVDYVFVNGAWEVNRASQ